MGEFLGSYGFFILIALLMVICHLGHGRGHGRRRDDGPGTGGSPPGGGHQH